MYALQVKPGVVPLLERLLTEGTFQASALQSTPSDSSASPSGASSSSSSSAIEVSPDAHARLDPAERGEVEQCRARLIFTAEKSTPWLEKLVTQIKVSINSPMLTVACPPVTACLPGTTCPAGSQHAHQAQHNQRAQHAQHAAQQAQQHPEALCTQTPGVHKATSRLDNYPVFVRCQCLPKGDTAASGTRQ